MNELKEFVCDLTKDTANVCRKTTDEMAECAGRNCKLGKCVKQSIEMMELKTLDKPVAPTPTVGTAPNLAVDPVDKAIFDVEIRLRVKDLALVKASMQKACSLMHGQCSDSIHQKVDSMPNATTIANDGDCVGLLKNIKQIMHNFESAKHPAHALCKAKRSVCMCMCRQDREPVAECFETFQEQNGSN